MKVFFTLILITLAASAYGQSGQWVQTSPSGCKAFTWRDGTVDIEWDGGCKEGKLHGIGSLNLYKDKNLEYSAVGNYLQGKANGQGTFIFTDGKKYVGEWKDGKLNGEGTFTWENGNLYVGEFKDGKKHGQGTFTFADGRVSMGEWAEDKANGRQIQYGVNGNIKASGIFRDDVLVTSQYIDPSIFTRIAINKSTPTISDTQPQELERRQQDHQANEKKITATNPKLKAVVSGEVRFSCGISCSFKFGYNRRQLRTYHDNKNWTSLAEKVYDLQYQSDVSYYYLAKASEELGFHESALIYYNLALNDNNKCRGVPNVCDGFNFPEDINAKIAFIHNQNSTDKSRLPTKTTEVIKPTTTTLNFRLSLKVSASEPDPSGVVTINIQTNTDTSSLKINDEEIGGKPNGIYSVNRVARIGQETKFTIAGVDVNGNTDTKTVTVFRQAVDSKVVFPQLNAANVKQQPAREAVAIIIGIEKYKRVAKADFANADAQVFYDYASRALGIKPENIKLLVDDKADDIEILQSFQNWLPLKVKKGKTDVYVFFSGHGYPSEDGMGLYFLPYGVDKNYMDRTAVKQKEVVTALQAVQPKSVTMFIDSCYSGQTRGGETLVAGSKPIALKQSETAYPPEFTVITASTMDQISWSSPDLKHGLFSYYLMKGMEGDSDINKDGKVTVAEMQEYLTDMVGRHAMGMNRNQQPQLFGDPNKVLISR
jgi:hypothetical protein